MVWRYAKIILASTAAIVAVQVVKKMYKYFSNFNYTECDIENHFCSEIINFKCREINDVILFSDEATRFFKIPPEKNLKVSASREINCFKLIKYIKSARETLDVCMYLITSKEITDHIIRLGQRHVLVRIVVDSDLAYAPISQVKKLEEYSFIQVQANKKPILMHHKFCIIDGPKAVERKNLLKAYAEKLNVHAKFKHNITPRRKCKGFVMSGSLNWSTQAMVANNESVIVTSQPSIVEKFESEFSNLWEENEPALMTTKPGEIQDIK